MFPQGPFIILANIQKVKSFLENSPTTLEVLILVSKIRQLCKDQGKTLFSLEQECGLGNGTIHKWDRSSPSVAKVTVVADALGVSVAYLIGEQEKKPNPVSKNGKSDEVSVRFRRNISKTLSAIDDAEFFFLGAIDIYSEMCSIAEGSGPLSLSVAYRASGILKTSMDELLKENYEPDVKTLNRLTKPTPVSKGGPDDMEELLMRYVRDLTSDQKQMLLAQMQVMKKMQKEASLPSVLE